VSVEEQFRSLIKMMAYESIPQTIRVGVAFNVQEATCEVKIEDYPTLTNVRLCVIQDTPDSKIVIKPKNESRVLIGIIHHEESEAFIAQCSEIESVEITIGSVQLLVNETGVVIKKGDDNLLQALQLLIESVLQISIIYGNNPNFMKLNESLRIIQNILKNA
jgi:hypothetical protein